MPHEGFSALALSPDGARIAVAQPDGNIALRRSSDGVLERTILSRQHSVNALAFSPDGALIASGCDWAAGPPTLVVWRVDSGEVVARVDEDHTSITALAFSRDSAQVLTLVGTDEWASFVAWSISTARRVWEVAFSDEHVCSSLAVSPVAPLVAVCRSRLVRENDRPAVRSARAPRDDRGGVELWNYETHACLWRSRAGSGAVGFSPDGERVVVAPRYAAGVRILATTTGRLRYQNDAHCVVAMASDGRFATGTIDLDPFSLRLFETGRDDVAERSVFKPFFASLVATRLPRPIALFHGDTTVMGNLDLTSIDARGAKRWSSIDFVESSEETRRIEALERVAASAAESVSSREEALRALLTSSLVSITRLRDEGYLGPSPDVLPRAAYGSGSLLIACSIDPLRLIDALATARAEYIVWAPLVAHCNPSSAPSIEAALRALLCRGDLVRWGPISQWGTSGSELARAHVATLELCVREAVARRESSDFARALWFDAFDKILAAGGYVGPHIALHGSLRFESPVQLADRLLERLRDRSRSPIERIAARLAIDELDPRRCRHPSSTKSEVDAIEAAKQAANELLISIARDSDEPVELRDEIRDRLAEIYPPGVEILLRGASTPRAVPPVDEVEISLPSLSRQLSIDDLLDAMQVSSPPSICATALLVVPSRIEWDRDALQRLEPAVRARLSDHRAVVRRALPTTSISSLAADAYRAISSRIVDPASMLPALLDALTAALEGGGSQSPLDPVIFEHHPDIRHAAVAHLQRIVHDRDRPSATRCLAIAYGAGDVALLRACLADSSEDVSLREEAARWLRRVSPAVDELFSVAACSSETASVRIEAINSLVVLGDNNPATRDLLLHIVRDTQDNLAVRLHVAATLRSSSPEEIWGLYAHGELPPQPIAPIENFFAGFDASVVVNPLLAAQLDVLRKGYVAPSDVLALIRDGHDLSRMFTAIFLASSVASWAPELADEIEAALAERLCDARSLSVVFGLSRHGRGRDLEARRCAYDALCSLLGQRDAGSRARCIEAILTRAQGDSASAQYLFGDAASLADQLFDDAPEVQHALALSIASTLASASTDTARADTVRQNAYELLDRCSTYGKCTEVFRTARDRARQSLREQQGRVAMSPSFEAWMRGRIGWIARS